MINHPMDIKPKCIIYIRVSDPSQVDGTGLAEQEERCREYAEREKWEVVDVYREEGVSAKMMKRPEFSKALDFLQAQKGKVKYFLMHKLDRISRNVEDQLPIMQALRLAGTELKSASENLENTSAGRFMRNVLWATANFDNEVRAERCHAGSLRRFKEGYWVHIPHAGYVMRLNEVIKRTESIPDPNKAPHIIRAFERRADGWSYEEIATEMNKRGYRTRRGKKIGTPNVEKILTNSFYMGLMRAFHLEVWGKHKPIISKELWYKAQAVTKERSRNSSTKLLVNPIYPLRGDIYCGMCGRRLTASAPRGRSGKVYAYYHHAKYKCEAARNIPLDEIEQLFIEQLQKLRPQQERWELLKAIILEVWQDQTSMPKEEQENTQRRISDLLNERTVLFEQHRKNPNMYTVEEFIEQKDTINRDIEELRSSRIGGEETDRQLDKAVELAYRLLYAPAEAWADPDLNIVPKKRFQRVLFPQGLTFDGTKIGTAEIALNLQLIHDVSLTGSNLVGQKKFGTTLDGMFAINSHQLAYKT
jgi:site-specific DNA recombinase